MNNNQVNGNNNGFNNPNPNLINQNGQAFENNQYKSNTVQSPVYQNNNEINSSNQTTQTTFSNSNYKQIPSNKEIKSNKSKIILISIIAIFIVIAGIFFFTRKVGNNNEYTAKKGETLIIEEKYQMLNIKALSSLEKYTISDTVLFNGDCIALKIWAENPTTTDLSFSLISFALTDANKNVIYTSNFLNTYDDSIFGKTIPTGETDEGYIYFYDVDSIDFNADYSKMNKVKYLKVSVNSELEKTGDKITGKKADYYLELN